LIGPLDLGIGVLLLACGLLLVGSVLVFLAIRAILHQRRTAIYGDDFATQIATITGNSPATAFLIAQDSSMRLPQQILLYTGQEIRLGRNKRSCTIVLNDISISRKHATILGHGRDFYIRDEGSRGGTFVNRVRLRPNQQQILHHNDTIQFYSFKYRFALADAPTQVADTDTVYDR
jgi:hypothetical protein